MIELRLLAGGELRADGGAIFGPVPKPLWEAKLPADARNRVPLACNVLLVRSGGKTLLVDAGYGDKAPAKLREQHGMEAGHPLLRSLAAAGVAPAEVDLLAFTHLPFDHAGGATTDAGGGSVPLFPRAKFLVQSREWADATGGAPELANAYFRKDLEPLAASGRLELLDGPAEVLPGVWLRPAPGHTPGFQLLELPAGPGLTFLGDLAPTPHHLQTFWTMGYDLDLLTLRREKQLRLGAIADAGGWAVFGHERIAPVARLRRDGRGFATVAESLPLPERWPPPAT